jgi:hypothetical protein
MGSFSKVMLHACIYIYCARRGQLRAPWWCWKREKISFRVQRPRCHGWILYVCVYRSVAINKNKINWSVQLLHYSSLRRPCWLFLRRRYIWIHIYALQKRSTRGINRTALNGRGQNALEINLSLRNSAKINLWRGSPCVCDLNSINGFHWPCAGVSARRSEMSRRRCRDPQCTHLKFCLWSIHSLASIIN